MNPELILRHAAKWETELRETLLRADASNDPGLFKALESHHKSLTSLLQTVSSRLPKHQTDLFGGFSPNSEMNQLVEKILTEVSRLKLPELRRSAA